MYFSKSLSWLLVLIAVIALCVNLSAARRGGGGGVRGGGSRGGRGGSKGGGKKSSVKTSFVVAAAVMLARPRFRIRSPSVRSSDYFYYSSDELDSSFEVNNNHPKTAFFLAKNDEDIYDCLIVYKNVSSSQCPAMFEKYVTNSTKFFFPSEFTNKTQPKISPSEISLCCGTSALVSSLLAPVLMIFAILRIHIFQ